MRIKQILENHLGDLRFWQTVDTESVNHYTGGTPYFSGASDLNGYVHSVESAIDRHRTEVSLLLGEARMLAEKVNLNRFEGTVPSDYDTTRLCEVLDILLERGSI
jgi:hypothetical protein